MDTQQLAARLSKAVADRTAIDQLSDDAPDLDWQLCAFILRGIGLNDAAVARHLHRDQPLPEISDPAHNTTESA